jgi:DNA-binding transcriptional LysR family regulator
MIAVPIGPRTQRFAAAAAPAYLDARGRPQHPRDLLSHNCLRTRFSGGSVVPYEFERDGEIIRVDPPGQLIVRPGAAGDLLVRCAIAGLGIINSFDDMLAPHFESGELEPVLESWWESFSGPLLYYPGRRHLPAPLRAFVDFIKAQRS